MLIANKKSFSLGALLMITFIVVLIAIFSHIFPGATGKGDAKVNGLDFADNLFNRLSKGSSNFLDDVKGRIKPMAGKEIELTITLKKAASAEAVVTLFKASGATASAEGGAVHVKGDFGKLLESVVDDSDHIYHDRPDPVSAKYGMDGYKALGLWWEGLQPMIMEMQKQKLLSEARIVDAVIRRAVEPAYNFQQIPISSVKTEFTLMSSLLVFYVVYTLWFGFAIFNLFDGMGLTMKKGKKQEA